MKFEVTVEDYQKAGEEFWPKYWYVAKELGENAKTEDVLKVMESLAGVAMKQKVKDKIAFDDDSIYLKSSGKTIMKSKDYVNKLYIDDVIRELEKKVK